MRKLTLFTLLLISISSAASAQSFIPDDLRMELRNMPNDSNKVKKLASATSFLPFKQPDSAIYYADSIIHFSEKIKFEYGIGLGYSLKAEAYLYKGDYSRGLYFSQQRLLVNEALKDQIGIADSHSQLGSFLTELGDYKQAIAEKSRSKQMIYSIGKRSYYDRSSDTIQPNEIRKLLIDYQLANIYLASNMPDTALMIAKKVLTLDHDLKHGWSAPPVLLGDIYYKINDYKSALLSYDIKSTFNFEIDSAKNFIGKASVFAKIHLEDSCILYARKALEISQRIKFSKGVMLASEILSTIYENIDPKKAIEHYKISTTIKDSLYSREKINQFNGMIFNDELRKLDAKIVEDSARNKFRIRSLLGIMFTLLVTGILLWRNNQHKKTANKLLQHEKQTVEKTLQRLQSTQSQLIQSEKMASLGELTAGIAHEIQNPLNFVNNFSEVNKELASDLEEEIDKGNYKDAKALAKSIRENEEKITNHGKRADAIVKGMLQHSRSSSGIKEPTDINALCDEYLRLSYHGLRAKDKSFNAKVETNFDSSIDKINVVPQDIGRAVLNLMNNAFYAVAEKKKQMSDADNADDFEPTVSVRTKIFNKGKVIISIKDNGNGIPASIKEKIFQPFFTTKPAGQGTGLGLSLSYDIIKAHGGELTVETKEGDGSKFIVHLPG